jgi:hypothetical protein
MTKPRMICALVLGFVSLPGCTTTRYVAVPCISKDQALPAEPEKVAGKLTGKADEDVKIIAGSAVRLRSWGQGLHGILEGCRAL